MRVLDRHEPAISNHCVLCGNGLDRERQDIIIDTNRDFDLPGHQLDGRLFVCQGCVFDIAKAAGLLTATQLDDAKAYLRKYRNTVEEIHERVAEHLDNARDAILQLPAAPNLDHLDTPEHVLVAEKNEAAAKRTKKKDWIEPTEDEAPF